MSPAPTKADKPAKKRPREKAEAPQTLTLCYRLSELPSAQHRAGLAGLLLMLRFLQRQAATEPTQAAGVLTFSADANGLTLEIDSTGLQRLFDEVYKAAWEEQEEGQQRKTKAGEIIPPIRVAPREIRDEKGKVKTKNYYIYNVVVPAGRLLVDLDPHKEKNGPWIRLWRSMIWSILRGVPATRQPFEDRADGTESKDVDVVWQDLVKSDDHAIELPSTYYLGAQAITAEDVAFKDRARNQLLLHFWPYAAQIYVPRVLEDPKARQTEFVGYALAIPDVANLTEFCDALTFAIHKRKDDLAGYRPREAVVDLALESALHLARRLGDVLTEKHGKITTADLVLGFDVIHVNKEGNNIRILSAGRFDPEWSMVENYTRLDEYQDFLFRRQLLLNLLERRPWYHGFARLVATLPYKEQLIGSPFFRRDANRKFKEIREVSMNQEVRQTEDLIYGLISTYLASKMKSKHDLVWEEVKDNEKARSDYHEKKRKLAQDAFLAIRSRTADSDFINYFAESLCSVKHYLKKEEFTGLSKTLRETPQDVRTLTLLALSALS